MEQEQVTPEDLLTVLDRIEANESSDPQAAATQEVAKAILHVGAGIRQELARIRAKLG